MPIKKISEELVWEISQSYPNLKLLNLANNHIRVVENLEPLTALERLNLSGPTTICYVCMRGFAPVFPGPEE